MSRREPHARRVPDRHGRAQLFLFVWIVLLILAAAVIAAPPYV